MESLFEFTTLSDRFFSLSFSFLSLFLSVFPPQTMTNVTLNMFWFYEESPDFIAPHIFQSVLSINVYIQRSN